MSSPTKESTNNRLADGLATLKKHIDVNLSDRLGSGAFGNVYAAAWKQQSDQKLAVKVVDASRLSVKARHQLCREIVLHTQCSHPNILRCLGAYELEGRSSSLHLVLSRAAGDLGTAMRNGASSAVKLLAPRLTSQLLRALAHLHDECSIVHADVKPSNLLLSFDGTLQLCDLGAAARIDSGRGGRSTIVGSPAYTAPEVVAIGHLGLEIGGASYSFPADLWSVGVVLVELLTAGASLPFAAEPRDAAAQPSAICFRPPRLEPASAFSASARSLVLRLLSKQAYLRPTATEALEEYASYLQQPHAVKVQQRGQEQAPEQAQEQQQEEKPAVAVAHTVGADEQPAQQASEALQTCLACLAQSDEGSFCLEAPAESAGEFGSGMLSPPPPPPPPGLARSSEAGDDSSSVDDSSPMSLPSWTSSMVDGGSPESDLS